MLIKMEKRDIIMIPIILTAGKLSGLAKELE
jgi:hypothetical protein